MKNNKALWTAAFLLLLLSAAIGWFYTAVYLKWVVPLYSAAMALIFAEGAAAFALLAKAKERQKGRVFLSALLGGVIAAGGVLGLSFAVNVLVYHERGAVQASLATAVFGFLFALVSVLRLWKLTEERFVWKPLLAVLLCVALFACSLSPAAKPLLPIKYDHPFSSKIQLTEGLENVSKQENKLLINADDSHWWGFWNELAKAGKFDDASLNQYVLQYADSGVTDLLFNIFCQSSDVPSEIMTFRGDLYGKTEQNGSPVDYGNYYGLNAFYNEQHIDIFAKWIENCREVGIRPWLTLRMNDCHDPDEKTSQLRGELFYEAEQNGWTIGDEYGYYRHCLNYAVPEVRERMLDYTREQLLHYDVYGLELDFMREIYCFNYHNADTDEIVGIMNDYLRETAKIVAEAEAKHGHEIKLSVRMMRDLDQCRVYGFDVLTWCEEGLIDAVTVTPRFTTNDSAMPIADWKARCPGIEIWAGVETLVNTNSKGCVASAEVVRGYGAQYLTAGADGLYLFNYMSAGGVGTREREVYDTCGSLAGILRESRRHVVTYQDTVPDGWQPYDPLPLKVRANQTASLDVETGCIPNGAAVTVCVGLAKELADENDLTLTVCGKDCAARGRAEIYGRGESGAEDVAQGYCREDCFIYKFELNDPTGLPNLLTLTFHNAGEAAKVTYCEIDVTP